MGLRIQRVAHAAAHIATPEHAGVHTGSNALAGEFQGAISGNPAHLNLRAVLFESLFHGLFDFLLILAHSHINKVDHNNAAQISKLKLPRDFSGGFHIGGRGGFLVATHLAFTRVDIDGNQRCDRWRRDAIAWLRTHPPDLIVVANSDGYGMVDKRGRVIRDASAKVRMWKKGMTQTLRALPGASEVLVLGEAPDNEGDPVTCLQRNRGNIAACAVRPTAAKKRRFEVAERQAALAAGAQFRSLYGKVCSYDPCPLVQGDILMWRDHAHLTATFVKQLTPAVREVLRSALAAPEPTAVNSDPLGPPAPSDLRDWLRSVLLV